MRKTAKEINKLSNESLNTAFASLEEALMADTIALKAMDEDIKTLNTMLKKLSFEMTTTTYLAGSVNGYKLGYDFDKKVIVSNKVGTPTTTPLTSASPSVRKDAHSLLEGLLIHLREKFEEKAKAAVEGNAATINVAPAQPKAGMFSRQA